MYIVFDCFFQKARMRGKDRQGLNQLVVNTWIDIASMYAKLHCNRVKIGVKGGEIAREWGNVSGKGKEYLVNFFFRTLLDLLTLHHKFGCKSSTSVEGVWRDDLQKRMEGLGMDERG